MVGDRSKSNSRFRAKGLSEEQINFLIELFRKAGIDIDKIIEKKKEMGQSLEFKDEMIIEVYDKNGNLKERRVI